MTKEKIKRIQFLEAKGKVPRAVRVTLTDGTVITIEAYSNGFRQVGGTTDEILRTALLAQACIGFLQGDQEESLSYSEVAFAEETFNQDLDLPEFDDDEIREQALLDFEDHLAHFREWTA